MKKLIAFLTVLFGLWIVPAMADTTCPGGAPTLEISMEMAKALEIPVIVIQGEGLAAWDKVVQDNDGPAKPEEITQLVVNADDAKAVLNGETQSLRFAMFQADGCPYGNGSGGFSGDLVVKALKAALDIEDNGI